MGEPLTMLQAIEALKPLVDEFETAKTVKEAKAVVVRMGTLGQRIKDKQERYLFGSNLEMYANIVSGREANEKKRRGSDVGRARS